ncbi:acyl dehydratase [Aquamicrobium terrae]|uniref:Acyl dehydratase n=1 Tax=Aquamicrobium terrae TaxID=1324945 RepID=A0ABV2N7F3_9HYPH
MMVTEQLFFEDVQEGNPLPDLTFGPLTAPILMRWSAAIENWHRIHYDRPFAIQHDHLPDLLVNGTLKQQFIMQALRRSAGVRGWVWKARFQFRGMNLVGETLRVWSNPAQKRELGDYGLVALDIGILNDEDVETTPGRAVVALPYRDREAAGVPYPFTPPDIDL